MAACCAGGRSGRRQHRRALLDDADRNRAAKRRRRNTRGASCMIYALEARRLGKRYGRHWGLHECSLRIPPGHVVGLIGPNGAGKTTLLHLVVGLLAPSEGDVHVFGYSPTRNQLETLSRVGFV